MSQVQEYSPDFTSVSLPTPAGGWEKNRLESGGSEHQAKAYERFSSQKNAGEAAASVVKDMNMASNAESAPIGELPASSGSGSFSS